jgi:LysM repeat protein
VKLSKIIFVALVATMLVASVGYAGTYTVTVERGNTLSGIAAAKGVPIAEFARLNGIKNWNHVKVGQKLTIPEKGLSARVEHQQNRPAEKQKVVAPKGADYQNVYSREMGNPFAPRKNGEQILSGTEYFRHRDNIMKHGISKAGAEDILSQKIKGMPIQKDFLPNGTVLESVSFGRNQVWSGGVLVNIYGKPGLNTVMYCAWTGECILDALNCGNYINPRKIHVPPGAPPVTVPEQPVPTPTPPCPTCPDQVEIDTGLYASISDPGGSGETRGLGAFAEMLYWKNFKQDCSSEYWWGLGGLASAYVYQATNFPSEGWGGRLAAEAGLKRNWANKEGLFRQWVIKARLGVEYSHWENGERDWFINQVGPVGGVYGEYRHEIIKDRLSAFLTAELWFGLGSHHVGTNLSGIGPSSKLFGEFLAGLDYQFAPKWVLRGYVGFDYQGWDGRIPFVPGVEVRHELDDNWGTVSVGVQGKIYATINPALLVYAKWETNKLVPRLYERSRQAEIKSAGKGIGGRNGATVAKQISNSPPPTDAVDPPQKNEYGSSGSSVGVVVLSGGTNNLGYSHSPGDA